MAITEHMVDDLQMSAYTVPTDAPESDGTLEWDHTTIVIARVSASGHSGLGYAYGAPEAARLAGSVLRPAVEGRDVVDIAAVWANMAAAVRNIGWTGVNVLQVDATRCGGITGFVRVAALCEAQPLPLSAHTAPTLHAHTCCCVPPAIHVEFFHDHARVEQLLFEGLLRPDEGQLRPDAARPGLGLELKQSDAAPYLVWSSR